MSISCSMLAGFARLAHVVSLNGKHKWATRAERSSHDTESHCVERYGFLLMYSVCKTIPLNPVSNFYPYPSFWCRPFAFRTELHGVVVEISPSEMEQGPHVPSVMFKSIQINTVTVAVCTWNMSSWWHHLNVHIVYIHADHLPVCPHQKYNIKVDCEGSVLRPIFMFLWSSDTQRL